MVVVVVVVVIGGRCGDWSCSHGEAVCTRKRAEKVLPSLGRQTAASLRPSIGRLRCGRFEDGGITDETAHVHVMVYQLVLYCL